MTSMYANTLEASDGHPEKFEELRIWRLNSCFLYDLLILKRNSLGLYSCQWLPETDVALRPGFFSQKILLGRAGDGNSAFMVIQVDMPDSKEQGYSDDLKEELKSVKELSLTKLRVCYIGSLRQDIHRVRYSPQQNNIVAGRTSKASVVLFDISETSTSNKLQAEPLDILDGPPEKNNCFSLAWDPVRKGVLGAGGPDNGAAGEQKRFTLFDKTSHSVIESRVAHKKGVNCIEFHPQNANLFLTGSDDTTIALWDRRKTHRELYRFTDHHTSVTELHWNPISPSLFASAADSKVFLWDMTRIGASLDTKDLDGSSPELLFIHGGHIKGVEGFDWNSEVPRMIASVSLDEFIEIWSPGLHVLDEL
ncbi:Histone acetyltransferase type B subunit 2 [Galdieria sulphuraria]|nr:Histone acetyltransferase type B subunit 2 [Galdieria sulphuraria]